MVSVMFGNSYYTVLVQVFLFIIVLMIDDIKKGRDHHGSQLIPAGDNELQLCVCDHTQVCQVSHQRAECG